MEIHQLNYFVAVAETGSFSRAAEKCMVTQPSLSQQILKLEQELGGPLFDRLYRRVVLTDSGRLLLPRANAILSELTEIRYQLNQTSLSGQGSLSVGFIPTIAPFVLPRAIKRFSEQFPLAKMNVQEDLTEVLVQELIDGNLDVGIASLPIHNDLIRTQVLMLEPLLVASGIDTALSRKASLHVKELNQVPFIALSEMHCLGEQVQTFCFQQNLEINVVCHTTQLNTVQRCVAIGLGVSLVPKALAVNDRSGKIGYRTISDASPERKIAAATHKQRRLSYLAQQFITIVAEEYGTLQD